MADFLSPNFQGDDIRKELVDLSKELPTILGEVAKDAAQIKAACEYYSAFIKFVVQKYVSIYRVFRKRYGL